MMCIDCLDSTVQFKPIGAFPSFSVHPNAFPYGLWSNGLYNGEVFAYMEREVEWAIWERYSPQGEVVHAAVNGMPADNSSDYQPGKQGVIEAKRIGTTIARKAIELFFSLDGKLTNDAAVQSIVREINVMKTHASVAYVSANDQWQGINSRQGRGLPVAAPALSPHLQRRFTAVDLHPLLPGA